MNGQRFERLVVTGFHSRDANYNKRWLCQCDCGNTTVVLTHKLRRGETKSCGCLGKELRGASIEQAELDRRQAAKKSYAAMVKRCHHPSSNKYYRYGARGITVCDRWRFGESGKSGFECFFDDMGPKPVGCSVDRIDGTKGYAPGNCRWATAAQQARNRVDTLRVFCDGELMPWMDAAEKLGLDALLSRINVNPNIRKVKIKELLLGLS